MSLVTCPDCEKRHSAAAPFCPQCGRPAVLPPVAQPMVDEHPRGAIGPWLACPRCGSEEVRKLSLIYREGTAHVGAYAPGGGGTLGTAQSLMSRDAAPPQPQDVEWAILFAAIGLAIAALGGVSGVLAVSLAGIGVAIMSAAAAFSQAKWNRDVYPQLYGKWNDTFLCNRCDSHFIP
jgi:hypothetical protein